MLSDGQLAFADCPSNLQYDSAELFITQTSVTGHYEGVNELNWRDISLLVRRGGRDIQKMPRSHL
jgi:hypothetical protein